MNESSRSKYRFGIETDAAPDALIRILTPFAIQGARLLSVRHDQTRCGTWTTLEVEDLPKVRAEYLRNRLAQLRGVRSIDLDS